MLDNGWPAVYYCGEVSDSRRRGGKAKAAIPSSFLPERVIIVVVVLQVDRQ